MKNLKQKIALGLAGVSILGGSVIGGKSLYNHGYENGREAVKQKLERVAGIDITNCEHDMRQFWSLYQNSPKKDQMYYKMMYQRYLDERNNVVSIINDVSNDNVEFGPAR